MTTKSRLTALERNIENKKIPDPIGVYFQSVNEPLKHYEPNKDGISPFVFSVLEPVSEVIVTRGSC